jgi:hypothetical protein
LQVPASQLKRGYGFSANAKAATVLGSIVASLGTVESEGAADEAVLNKVHKKPVNYSMCTFSVIFKCLFWIKILNAVMPTLI